MLLENDLALGFCKAASRTTTKRQGYRKYYFKAIYCNNWGKYFCILRAININ
jgi:hypothetical protein